MEKSILSEYVDMKAEIKDLRRRIDEDVKAIERLNKMIVIDSVACGKKGEKPIRTVKVEGIQVGAIERRREAYEKRKALLQEKEISLIEKQVQVEAYISQMEKSELRTMFRFYFVDGMSYPKVSMEMNKLYPKRKKKYTDENVKKKIQRYLKNVPQCPDKKC